MAATTPILLLLFFVVLLSTSSSTQAPIPGLDTFLTQQSHRDPTSSDDSFHSLPHSLKKTLSSQPLTALKPLTLISSLLSLSLPVSLRVVLVGPSSIFPSTSPSLLSSFLSSSLSSDSFHVISPSSHSHSHSHSLSLSHSLHLSASLSSPSLSDRLSAALSSALSSSTASLRSSLLPVPFSAVDDVIRQDFVKQGLTEGGVYVYLLSLGPQSQNYAYSFPPGEGNGDSSSPGHTRCLGNVWTGKERYIWIDLNAGPVEYGPALSGDGILPRGEFHPLAVLHGGPKSQKALLADLASLVWSAYKVLLVPSLRIPVHFDNNLIVEFIHVHGAGSKGKLDPVGLDWGAIEMELRDELGDGVGGLLFKGQTLSFKTYKVSYDECPICSFAISRSISSYTSRFLFDNYTLIVSEYLDSKRLHHILSESAEEFRRAAGAPEDDIYGHVLPVYVFDLDYNTLLFLDRYHQTVAFRDMVVAVRTKTAQTVSDYSCNGRHVFTQARELERPLVGSILQSMWGVAPTHLSWSPRHNDTLIDYTWSVGHTPFGPFSQNPSLSFVQKDAARRNVLLTSLNYSISSAIDVLESIKAHGGDRKLLKQNRYVEYVQRWNLFKYKLDKAVSAMSHLDFDMALYYLRSSDHDLYALHSLVYHSTQELEASLVCFKDPPFPWGALSVSSVSLFALFYVYSRRDKLFRNKRKQF